MHKKCNKILAIHNDNVNGIDRSYPSNLPPMSLQQLLPRPQRLIHRRPQLLAMQRTVVRSIGNFPHLRAENHTIVFIDREVMRIEELVDVGRKGDADVKCAQLSMGEGLDMAGLS